MTVPAMTARAARREMNASSKCWGVVQHLYIAGSYIFPETATETCCSLAATPSPSPLSTAPDEGLVMLDLLDPDA